MKSVTSEKMRELDRRTIEDFGVPGEVLMERAGLGIAEAVSDIIAHSNHRDCKVLAFAGHGNNGGDAFVAVRNLNELAVDAEVVLCSEVSKIKGDALLHFEKMRDAGCIIHDDMWNLDIKPSSGPLIILDGLLGTGIEGEVRGPLADAIEIINKLGEKNIVVAIDVPSGMNSDTGEPAGVCVAADRTVTMALPKSGLLTQAATEYVGTVEVVDIGIPEELTAELESDLDLISGDEVSRFFERRASSSHKGSYGHVLVIAGAKGYAGAAAMASASALRSGAGLVTALVPESVAERVGMMSPEVMVYPAKETEQGSISCEAFINWEKGVNDFDAVLIGPGMTTHPDTGLIVRAVLAESKVPVILDADALNVLEGDVDVLENAECEVVITPHPGEMARLIGDDTAAVQAERLDSAVDLAEKTGVTVVLKGAGTVVAGAGAVPMINRTGNPGMGTAGMGDILAGLLAGFAASGKGCFESACAAVYIHGRAGDVAAMSASQTSLAATDLLKVMEELPAVFRELTGR